MLQVAVSGGEIRVVDVPAPALRPGGVLVATSHSLISAGTETAGLSGGGSARLPLVRALRNPALVRKVRQRIAAQGFRSTLDLVRSRLSSEISAGYSCAGLVLEVGEEIADLKPGDRVACAGAGYASHAAVNFVPRNLVARLPESVSFEEGAFATIGAIALQGVRRSAPELGETVAVVGLGLIGQLTAQILRAAGAVVIGADIRGDRVERARSLGMTEGFSLAERALVPGILERTAGRGADAVIVTAAGSNRGLLDLAFDCCRRKGRVVLVGDVPIEIQREKIYRKEVDFRISTSYGPGRYDPNYEEKGIDYPFAYVRWTEGRNLEEVLRLIATGQLRVRPLIDSVHPSSAAASAYATLATEPRPVGVLLEFGRPDPTPGRRDSRYVARRSSPTGVPAPFGVGVIGYGGYFRSALQPLLARHPSFRFVSACSRDGLTVRQAVERGGFERGTTDFRELLADPDVRAVFITTRHDRHFELAKAAVEAGKAVFVEKPMTLSSSDGRVLADLVAEKKVLLTVGFNRRFSPHAVRMKELLRPIASPKSFLYRINAGPLPPDHWLLDPAEGGGRILGEGVHFFDFLCFLAGSPPSRVVGTSPRLGSRDECAASLEFPDGSIGAVLYSAGGAPSAGKERVEALAGGQNFVLDDFQRLEAYGPHPSVFRTKTIEKGQRGQLDNFARALGGSEDLGVTAEDGVLATWIAEQALAQR